MPQQTDTLAGVKRPFSLPTASAAPHPRPSGRGAFRAGKRVPYNGVEYPSITAAAKAAGVSFQAFSQAVKRGTVHNVGTGPHRLDTRNPCAAHGWFWASQKEAARALGVIPETVTNHLDRGTFDRLVLRRLGINSAAAGLPPPVEN